MSVRQKRRNKVKSQKWTLGEKKDSSNKRQVKEKDVEG